MTDKQKRGAPPKRGEVAASFIHMRIDRKRKARYVATANREKMKLSDWIVRQLDAVAAFDDEKPPGNATP